MKTIIKNFEYVAIDFTLVLLIYSIINIKFYTGNVYILELFGVVAAAVCMRHSKFLMLRVQSLQRHMMKTERKLRRQRVKTVFPLREIRINCK